MFCYVKLKLIIFFHRQWESDISILILAKRVELREIIESVKSFNVKPRKM